MTSRTSDLAALNAKVQSRITSLDGGTASTDGANIGLPFDPILAPPSRPVFPRPNTNVASYKDWEKRDKEPASAKLKDLYNKFKGERCFIIGNGPSLNNHDLSKLEGEHVFAVNSFYYKTRETGFRPTFFVVEDDKVMEENYEHFVDYECPYKLFPTEYRKYIPESESTFFFKMNHGYYQDGNPYFGIPRFSTNAFEEVFCGQTVTYINLQLAHYMGFTQVYLIGMDFHYVIPKEHRRDGNLILSTTDDPNHFHKDYFGAGKTWKDPKLDRVAMNYRLAKLSYESAGRRIYNATIGGKLEIFDRVDYSSLFPRTNKRDADGNLLLPMASSFGEGSYQPKTNFAPANVQSKISAVSNQEFASLSTTAPSSGQLIEKNETSIPNPPAALEKDAGAKQNVVPGQTKPITKASTNSAPQEQKETPSTDALGQQIEAGSSEASGVRQLLDRSMTSLSRRWMLLLPLSLTALFPLISMVVWPGALFGTTVEHLFATAILLTGFALAYVAMRSYVTFRSIGSQLTFLSDQITINSKRRTKTASDTLRLRKRVDKIENEVIEGELKSLAVADAQTLDVIRILRDRIVATKADLEQLTSAQTAILTKVNTNSNQNDRLEKTHGVVRQQLSENAAALSQLSGKLSVLGLELEDIGSLSKTSQVDLEALIEKVDEMASNVADSQIETSEEITALNERTVVLESSVGSLEADFEQSRKNIDLLSETLGAIAPDTEQSKKDIELLSQRTSLMAASLEDTQTMSEANKQGVEELADKATELSSKVVGLETHSVSLDIAVVARSLRTMWLGGSGFERRTREVEREHGHVLMMDMLALIEREKPGSLAGKSLIEIGMTREPHRSQRSTQKLGLFAALTDLYYVGVDIDPKNVANAKRILPYLNPGAQAYVSKGEEFLRLYAGSIDFVYLDAYDFYHDNHSAERQEVYKKHLGSEISDEQCWKMHADCAETLIRRLSPGGVVALDDTWKTTDGNWAGKGKLAAPMFLEAGFEEIATSENTVCFQRPDDE